MNFILLFMCFVSGLFIVLIGLIVFKMIRKKRIPDIYYTPFDYITGQSTIEFHEEKEDEEQDNDQGDDLDKNIKKPAQPLGS
ncbi:DUF3951 domain-containing protein [Paenibacillus sp. CAA11]|uniref:DUF3951 domain-containing protein n=1 Tax=Paenibacillus sp. CAA11 TaxID=1532905 RepID=UPI000D342972|nr:DUF3951 domain-containing protein [Paenibacillus sp. CAA11]AWB44558.1 DUF3951 domain-containing protein [Paenibacillus sp. CAA11]